MGKVQWNQNIRGWISSLTDTAFVFFNKHTIHKSFAPTDPARVWKLNKICVWISLNSIVCVSSQLIHIILCRLHLTMVPMWKEEHTICHRHYAICIAWQSVSPIGIVNITIRQYHTSILYYSDIIAISHSQRAPLQQPHLMPLTITCGWRRQWVHISNNSISPLDPGRARAWARVYMRACVRACVHASHPENLLCNMFPITSLPETEA